MATPAAITARRELLATRQQRCTACKVVKELAEFTTRPSSPTGRDCRCRVCKAAQQKERRARPPTVKKIQSDLIAEYRIARPQRPLVTLSCCGAEYLVGSDGSGCWVHDSECVLLGQPARTPAQVLAARNGLALWARRGGRSWKSASGSALGSSSTRTS